MRGERGERRERQGRRPRPANPPRGQACEPAPEVEYVLPEAARGSDTDRIVAAIGVVATAVDNHAQSIIAAFQGGTPTPVSEIGLSINTVRGGCKMPRNTDRGTTNLLDTEGVILGIAAKNAAGEVGGVPADQYDWTSADTAHAAISDQTPHEDDRELTPYERWVGTPGTDNAAVVITVTHRTSGNTETLTLNIASTGPGEIGLSVGEVKVEP